MKTHIEIIGGDADLQKAVQAMLAKGGFKAETTAKESAKHTPGPWVVAKSYSVKAGPSGQWMHFLEVVTADFATNKSPCVAQITPREYRNTEREAYTADKEAEANARLIAAAPDLLNALKACGVFLTAWSEHETRLGKSESLAKQSVRDNAVKMFAGQAKNIAAAIAKAEALTAQEKHAGGDSGANTPQD